LSDHADVLCLVALAAGGDVELDALTLVERAIARPLDVGVVDEEVVALSREISRSLLGLKNFTVPVATFFCFLDEVRLTTQASAYARSAAAAIARSTSEDVGHQASRRPGGP
jgi:hypothetical protein